MLVLFLHISASSWDLVSCQSEGRVCVLSLSGIEKWESSHHFSRGTSEHLKSIFVCAECLSNQYQSDHSSCLEKKNMIWPIFSPWKCPFMDTWLWLGAICYQRQYRRAICLPVDRKFWQPTLPLKTQFVGLQNNNFSCHKSLGTITEPLQAQRERGTISLTCFEKQRTKWEAFNNSICLSLNARILLLNNCIVTTFIVEKCDYHEQLVNSPLLFSIAMV